MSSDAFTGRARRRKTRPSVRVVERIARVLISIGGIGTILAVSGILVFLVWVVVPLFTGARFEVAHVGTLDGPRPSNVTTADPSGVSASARPSAAELPTPRPLAVGLDEYQLMGWVLDASGSVTSFRLDTGERLDTRALFPDRTVTASAMSTEGDFLSLGFSDGTFADGRVGFRTEFAPPEAHPEASKALEHAQIGRIGNALVQRTAEGQLRVQTFEADLGHAIDPNASDTETSPNTSTNASAIRLIDRSTRGPSTFVCVLDADARLFIEEIRRRENLLTGEVTLQTAKHELPYEADIERGEPAFLKLAGGGDVVYLAWKDGTCRRYDARDLDDMRLAEEIDLVDGTAELTALAFLIGKTTLVSGDSSGRVRGWFGTKPKTTATVDGITLVLAHELGSGGAAVRSLSASARNRVLAVGRDDGTVEVYHATSHKLLAEARAREAKPVLGIAIAPKEDGLFAFYGPQLAHWRMDLRHPEASLAALLTPVWYEGYERPEHVWQSSSGTDDFEPKLGLVPLIFGTLKATAYSMLFAVPIALLAAIFTSEFLSPRLRAPLKSMTEMMASLPSVVLGFLAAIVIAPFVQGVVPVLLASFATIPIALLGGAYLWQLLPQRFAVRFAGGARFAAIFCALPCGVLLACVLGPLTEKLLFGGNFLQWLDGGGGHRFGGWVILGMPASAAIVLVVMSRMVNPWAQRISAGWNRAKCARFDLCKFGGGVIACIALAAALASVLDFMWIDPRGSVLDTYVQRNALIVGFVMGFAVIPIIYTLAEDALSSVPAHLRLASLGAGATPWQTATRVVVPTAMSGLFSAVMIGLGRAVGETMIVLMATGNTPVMSWNIFNGFRTLSANIAVELPEAVQNSTHYRTLFLAALCLFAMTFVFNTAAELIRQRFRKRAFQL